MCKQRSRALWLKEGDQSTKCFHNRASHKYKRNRIDELKNEAGVVCTNEEEIADILVNYYQQLFFNGLTNTCTGSAESSTFYHHGGTKCHARC